MNSAAGLLRNQPDEAPPQSTIDGLLALYQAGCLAEAVREGEVLVARYPRSLMIYNILGAACIGLGAFEKAEAAFRNALAFASGHAELHNNLGAALEAQGRFDEALTVFEHAAALNPSYASAYYNQGNILRKTQRFPEAVACYERALELKPDYAEAYNNLGLVQRQLRALPEAIASFERAIALNPGGAEAYNNIGLALQQLNRPADAIPFYQHALSLNPAYPDPLQNIASALADVKDYLASAKAFELALARDPGNVVARAQMAFVKMQICDFSAERVLPSFEELAERAPALLPPWMMLAFGDDPAWHLRCSQTWARASHHAQPTPAPMKAEPNERIRVGYFSADFQSHATLHLMAGLLREHDRERFEIVAYSYGAFGNDVTRSQLIDDVEHFIDIQHLSDAEVLDLVREHELDIAVDLKGYTEQSRSHLFAHRLAPVQINYIGYPGSMGCPSMDYLIADRQVIPEESRRFYSENLITLPGCYQPNDDRRAIAETGASRADFGLPQDGFVFCAFHQSYKMGRDEFDIWMRLLGQVAGSVLWLLRSNDWVEANLRREAEARGIDPDRLVFADKVPQDQHLARLRLADLFLDTFNVNAHTTASDALWAGLPFVTKAGRQFAARVGASVLQAIGLPELITESEAEYEALVLELATQPTRLAEIRVRLEGNRLSQSLFDTVRYTRKLEEGYVAALQRHVEGLAPADIAIA
ncbi:tetratricopeptide repeat protein [Novosphingobium sp. G106]|uniref:O-linked N-acetylglucosamine transferase, SPINDLY family protein n=1 Tax=Novosphingobium sp. G106 TaxID=2849500 RepID=UPI001C2CE360|nr:glycosyltransferase family 41 protein [Novosphingobium sp. G106]MBV1690286.1 tetratricopeptide repeat protein [Novosphingobium sp. G106]